jgi:hypothetical protein
MTNFLNELKELFDTFKADELIHLNNSKNHDSLLEVLQSSDFFMEQYINQQFKRSKRFKEKTYYNFRGYPVKLNTTKEMKLNTRYWSMYKIKKNDKEEELNFEKLKSSPVKVKELVLFTQGSRTRTQFECWTPMEMFLWWRTLRESGDQKGEWKIMDAVFFLFINQISQIINTYVINFKLNFYSKIIKKYEKNYYHSNINKYKINKYKKNDNIPDPYLKSLFYLKKYLEGLDKFYKSGGKYGLLLEVQILYYEYYEFELHLDYSRHTNNDYARVRLLRESKYDSDFYLHGLFQNNNENIHSYHPERIPHNYSLKRRLESHNRNIQEKNLFNIFQETLKNKNYSLVIFLSYPPNESKYMSLYSIPIIQVLGIEYDTHEGRTYSSLDQISHDLSHSNYLIYFLENLYQKLQKDEDIQEFFRRTIFLEELNKKALEEKMKLIKGNENNDFSIKRIYKGTLNTNENNKFKESEEKNSKKQFTSDSQKLLWWFLHEKKFNLHKVGVSENVNKKVAKDFFDIEKLKEKLQILIKHVKSNYQLGYYEKGKYINIQKLNENYITPIGFLNKQYFNKHGLDIKIYKERVIESINILIEICDFVLKQKQRYNYRNKNNNEYERAAIYGNINNNKVNKKVNKYLEKHPEFTNKNLQEYANNNKIGKIYNTNNEYNINRFKVDFIKRVKDKHKISRYIAKFIENNPELANNHINKLESLLKNKTKLEKLKEENPNSSNIELLKKLLQNFSSSYSIPNLNRNTNNTSTKKPITLRTLSNQRNAFIRGIMNNPNGSPLNNNNPNVLPLNP